MNQRVLLLTPPFTQLNTPYPATVYLKGFLNTLEIASRQSDLGIAVINTLFSKRYLQVIFDKLSSESSKLSKNARRIFALKAEYLQTIEPVMAFLQQRNETLAYQIANRDYLPEASRFEQLSDLEWAFGTLGIRDKARHLATLYLEDLSDLIIEAVDPHFGFSRYAERIATAADSFDVIYKAVTGEGTLITTILEEELKLQMEEVNPTLVAISIPFPGNLFAGLWCARYLKENYPSCKIAFGGGYVNTELRNLSDARFFEFTDFLAFDDGEITLLSILKYLDGQTDINGLKRTQVCEKGVLTFYDNALQSDFKQNEIGVPDYSDLPLKSYLSVLELANPMHRLWSDGRWNKLTLAHGCYWGKCTFCDISLDYIKRYEPSAAQTLVDKIEALIEQTGENGFHFVDEAAPPALMKEMAIEILKRNLTVVWWANIRFEKSFTNDICRLLKASGCIAVSGGLEVASDRLLKLIEKGVTVEQVAQVCSHFTDAGIMVHAYLMFGFPTQTEQETIDALEMVRQLFEQGVLQSGFWHRFAMTAHSPVGINPDQFKVDRVKKTLNSFANNDLEHIDTLGADHVLFAAGLRKSLFNYMHGIGFELPLNTWFEFKVPRTKIAPNHIQLAINKDEYQLLRANKTLLWIGPKPAMQELAQTKKGQKLEFTFQFKQASQTLSFDYDLGTWLAKQFDDLHYSANGISVAEFKSRYTKEFNQDLELVWHSKTFAKIRELALLLV